VNDHMGQADQSKKAKWFQSSLSSPTAHQFLRTITRFSNHTATTSSNLTAFLPLLRDHRPENKVFRDEAIENISGTLIQNVLFQFVKASVAVPLLLTVAGLFRGKDWDEAARDAQEASDAMLKAMPEDNLVVRNLKQVFFGTARNLYSEWKDDRAARYSAGAEITSKVLMEVSQGIPTVGVLAGYSSIMNLSKPTIQKLSKEFMSVMSGGFGFGDDKIGTEYEGIDIPRYKETGVGEISGLTAPTSVLYDILVAGNKAYNGLTEADASGLEMAQYVLVQILGTREWRTAMDKELTE